MEDLYGDLDDFDYKNKYEELQEKQKTLQKQILKMVKGIQSLAKEKEQLAKENVNLKENISSLYKTAVAEISRKDRMINELREELNTIIFRKKIKKESVEEESATHVQDNTEKTISDTTISNTKNGSRREEKHKEKATLSEKKPNSYESNSRKRHRSRSRSPERQRKKFYNERFQSHRPHQTF